MLPRGRTSVTFAFTNVTIHDPGEDPHESLDLMVRHGFGHRLDVGAKYTVFAPGGRDEDAWHVLLADAKYSLIPGRLAATMPVGFVVYQGDADIWQAHPQLIFTQPISHEFELDLSGRAIVMESGGDWDTLVAGSLGFRLGPDTEGFAIHPEVSMLFDPGKDGYIVAFGAAACFSH